MKIYVFGNPDVPEDNKAFSLAEKLKDCTKDINFIFVKPNEDLPFSDEKNVIVMDVIKGIDETRILNFEDINALVMSPRTSAHDFDLGFQLNYLKKLGRLKEIKIIGLPYGKRVSYLTIQSILRKLVAQDIHGS